MNTDGEELIADLLDGIVDSLDVPDEMLERTQNLYDDVGEFMRDDLPDDSMWSFRPQGSANLGTIVLPAPGDELTSTPWPLGTFGRKASRRPT